MSANKKNNDMSADKKKESLDREDLYNSPEMVRLGGVLELTSGSPDLPLADGRLKPNGYKDI